MSKVFTVTYVITIIEHTFSTSLIRVPRLFNATLWPCYFCSSKFIPVSKWHKMATRVESRGWGGLICSSYTTQAHCGLWPVLAKYSASITSDGMCWVTQQISICRWLVMQCHCHTHIIILLAELVLVFISSKASGLVNTHKMWQNFYTHTHVYTHSKK